MKHLIVFCLLLGAGLLLATCAEKDPANCPAPAKSVINPNGDTELALLMRSLFDESLVMRQAIEAGNAPVFTYDPAAILTAHATEPEKAASPAYKSLGAAYIAATDALKNASPENRKSYYQGMVHSCIACHEQLCPGPTRKINRLFFEELDK